MRSRAALLYHISDTQNHLSKRTLYERNECTTVEQDTLEILFPKPELDIVTRLVLACPSYTSRGHVWSTEIHSNLGSPRLQPSDIRSILNRVPHST